VVLVF